MGKKRHLKKNGFFLEMLIYRRFGKNWHFQSDHKKTKFSSKFLNIRRYRQKLFVQSDQNKTFFSRCNFPRNVNKYFRRYGQKTTFSKWTAKKRHFHRYADIYRDMGKNKFFQSHLKKTSSFSKCKYIRIFSK